MKIGYFEEEEGVKSSSRLSAFIVVMTSLGLAVLIIAVGCYIAIHEMTVSSLVAAAGAAGTEFGVVAGAAMYYMYNQKKTEGEQEEKLAVINQEIKENK